MAAMWQEGMAMREFTEKFERHTQDAGMAKEDAKFHLALALHQDTLSHLDAYVPHTWG